MQSGKNSMAVRPPDLPCAKGAVGERRLRDWQRDASPPGLHGSFSRRWLASGGSPQPPLCKRGTAWQGHAGGIVRPIASNRPFLRLAARIAHWPLSRRWLASAGAPGAAKHTAWESFGRPATGLTLAGMKAHPDRPAPGWFRSAPRDGRRDRACTPHGAARPGGSFPPPAVRPFRKPPPGLCPR